MAPRRRNEEENAGVPEQRTPEDEVLIQSFENRPHYEPIWVDQGILVDTRIHDQVVRLLTASGWPGLLTLSCEADLEDTSEFLATFNFVNTDERPYIRYTHRQVQYTVTLRRLRTVFGWSAHGEIFQPAVGMGYAEIWAMLSTFPYRGGESKAKALRDAIYFYLHHIFSKTVFAKKNADKVGKMELSVLHLVRSGRVVDWAFYFCNHMKNLRANSPICCGGMITFILRRLHSSPVLQEHHILHITYADRIWFSCGQNIQMRYDGTVEWCHSVDPTLNPDPVPRRGRGRPRGTGTTIVERGESSRAQEQRQQPPPEFQQQQPDYARAHIDHMFHIMRSTFMYGQEITWVPAPPGWFPGQPIPPEYMQPHPPGH